MAAPDNDNSKLELKIRIPKSAEKSRSRTIAAIVPAAFLLACYFAIPQPTTVVKPTPTPTPTPALIRRFTITPDKLSFPSTAIGTASRSRQIELSSPGQLSLLRPSGGNMVGDYLIETIDCKEMQKESNCKIRVVFKPQNAGRSTTPLVLTDSNGESYQVQLAGKAWGAPTFSRCLERLPPESEKEGGPLALDPKRISFEVDPTRLDGLSDEATIKITNAGRAPVKTVSVSHGVEDHYFCETNCKSLLPGKSCEIEVRFVYFSTLPLYIATQKKGHKSLSDVHDYLCVSADSLQCANRLEPHLEEKGSQDPNLKNIPPALLR